MQFDEMGPGSLIQVIIMDQRIVRNEKPKWEIEWLNIWFLFFFLFFFVAVEMERGKDGGQKGEWWMAGMETGW